MSGLGTRSIMGCRLEATWGASIAPTNRLLMMSEGIEFNYDHVLHEYLHGSAGMLGMQKVFNQPGGTLELEMAYDRLDTTFVGSDLPLALAMGVATYVGGSGSNQYTFQDALAQFATFAWNKQDTSDPWELMGGMINSMTISGAAGESLKMSLDIMGHKLTIGSGATTTVANLDALNADLPPLILFKHLVFRVGNQANILAAGDSADISSFSITVNNNLSDSQQTTTDNSANFDINQPIQPVRNGKREVTLEITMPRYSAETLFDFATAETALQATLEATDPDSPNSEWDVIFPNMKIETPSANVGGPEAIEQTFTFRCFKQNAGQTYKPLFTDTSTEADSEVNFETDNERTVSPLV